MVIFLTFRQSQCLPGWFLGKKVPKMSRLFGQCRNRERARDPLAGVVWERGRLPRGDLGGVQPCWEDCPHVRRQDDLRRHAGGEIFRALISYTSHISLPHFMVLTDSIMMFHPDFQGDLLRLCKRNKPSHGRYYGLYCRKGLKTNSKFDRYMACGLISLLELCIISIHPNLPTEWPFFHTFLSLRWVRIISTHPIWSNFLISPGARLRASDKSEVRRNKLHTLWGGGPVMSSIIIFEDTLWGGGFVLSSIILRTCCWRKDVVV